jgi:hypothetical protein
MKSAIPKILFDLIWTSMFSGTLEPYGDDQKIMRNKKLLEFMLYKIFSTKFYLLALQNFLLSFCPPTVIFPTKLI